MAILPRGDTLYCSVGKEEAWPWVSAFYRVAVLGSEVASLALSSKGGRGIVLGNQIFQGLCPTISESAITGGGDAIPKTSRCGKDADVVGETARPMFEEGVGVLVKKARTGGKQKTPCRPPPEKRKKAGPAGGKPLAVQGRDILVGG